LDPLIQALQKREQEKLLAEVVSAGDKRS
jgi:hypothetical protein